MKAYKHSIIIFAVILLTSCQTSQKSEGYELDYDLCKTIKTDSTHRLWSEEEWVQELTIKTCDMIIFEVENPELI